MVNTRRSETIGLTPDISTPLESNPASDFPSESEVESESEDNNSWTAQRKRKRILQKKPKSLAPRVRELRSRFVYNQRNYSANRLGSENINAPNRIPLEDGRHNLAMYSPRDIHNDLHIFNDASDDEIYVRKSRRSRHSRSHMDRIERRTALSLRPISQKCYADSLSVYLTDTELRRSKRQRKVQTMSWLADDQMHIMGYPNLNTPGFSEEDSRDGQHIEDTRRSTRHSNDINKRREIKNPKYLYDYETNTSRRRRSDLSVGSTMRNKKDLRSSRESNDKENNEGSTVNGRPRRSNSGRQVNAEDEKEKKIETTTAEDDSNDGKMIQENGVTVKQEAENDEKINENGDDSKFSDNDVLSNLRTREQKKKLLMKRTRRRAETQAESRKSPFDDSSSSESEGPRKGYSLRNRPPKPQPMPTLRRELPRRRRCFDRRRKVSNSSSSSSSSDSDMDSRRNKILGRQPKTQHSKNDQKMKLGAGLNRIMPIGPETIDATIRFSSIGGLDEHIHCLKEMILMPMMYPDVFKQFQIQPPRGVLFHGPPGTGKTLIARALANECSIGLKKVSFFMRKGADLLSKWIGESEKQLRLLFEQATEMQPSIIFFDELDGLAPVRSSRQDQVHASIVSTLLALMDGLDNRGEVIVIGATNRIDAIDPALRRPGRFDRELCFALPAKKEREAILKVHVSKWSKPPQEDLLSYLSETTVGYCGSDLRALCSEAVIQGFRRTYPQVYSVDYRLMLQPENVQVKKIDFMRAKSLLVPASHRITQGLGRKLMTIVEPLLNGAVTQVFTTLEQMFPHAVNTALAKVKLSPNIRPAHLLLIGEGPECGQTLHLAPAILYKMEHLHTYLLDLATLFKETGRSPEETCIQVFNEARRNIPSVIYIPNIDNWWSLVSETVKAIVNIQLSQLESNIPILLLATADTPYNDLPNDIQTIFSRYRKEVYQLEFPNPSNRESFYRPLLIDLCMKPPRSRRRRPKTPPPLPRAKTPPPTPLTAEQSKKLYEQEEHTLRELRIFLREICKKLANNKLFYMFTKPVDVDEVPDYMTIIKEPMDLETMMTKVDFHRYECAKDFLKDVDLICRNALEYNPARTSADKQIRHRACSLRDHSYTLIKNEMDSDFEEKCCEIASKRQARNCVTSDYLPAYIQTPENFNVIPLAQSGEAQNTEETKEDSKIDIDTSATINTTNNESPVARVSGTKRRRRPWQRGCVRRRKRSKLVNNSDAKKEKESSDDDDSKENLPTLCSVNSLVNGIENEDHSNLEAPLLIHCDEEGANYMNATLRSPTRRLSDLMSPSELLENSLDIDDIDQALNEEVEGRNDQFPVNCDKNELDKVLMQTVHATSGCSVQSLLDLYNQFSRIVKKFTNSYNRKDLPKELLKELSRFKEDCITITRERRLSATHSIQ